RSAHPDTGREVLADSVRNQKLRVLGPPVTALGKPDFLIAKRLSMSLCGILFVGRTVADMSVEDEEGRPALGLLEDLESVLDSVDIVGVTNPQNVPAVP